MSGQQLTNTHPTGKTTGTAQRPSYEHTGQALTFDLMDELQHLRQEQTWDRTGHNSRTLVKEGDLRLVLMALKAGSHIAEHHLNGRLALQVLAGRLRLQMPGRDVVLPAGQILAINYAVGYQIEALEESSCLLTIAYPAGDDTQR